jgi:hypothetical protein
MITNMAGVAETPVAAAAWLFGLSTLTPLAAVLALRRLR